MKIVVSGNFEDTSLIGYYAEEHSTFIETVGRLVGRLTELGHGIFDKTDKFKSSFDINLELQDDDGKKICFFTLYDYKEDFELHIGGNSNTRLYLREIGETLDNMLYNTNPVDYSARTYYNAGYVYGIQGGHKFMYSKGIRNND